MQNRNLEPFTSPETGCLPPSGQPRRMAWQPRHMARQSRFGQKLLAMLLVLLLTVNQGLWTLLPAQPLYAAAVSPICYSNALHFDGYDDFAARWETVSGQTDNITMEAWIKPDVLGGFVRIMYNGNSGSSGYGIYLDGSTPVVFMGGVGGARPSATGQITVGAWQHVAAVRSGGAWQIYVNGNALGMANSGMAPWNPPAGYFTLGRNEDHAGMEAFQGSMDEVRFWNTARSAGDIQASMHFRLSGSEPYLAAYYDFDMPDAAAGGVNLHYQSIIYGFDGKPIPNRVADPLGLYAYEFNMFGPQSNFVPSIMLGVFGFASATYAAASQPGYVTVAVSRASGSEGAVQIDYATQDGTASAGSHYTATSGTLAFAPGETNKNITIPILTQPLSSLLDFKVNLSGPAYIPFSSSTTTVQIVDAVAPAVSSITHLSPASLTTNESSLTYRVVFSEAVTGVNASNFSPTLIGSLTASGTTVVPVNAATYDVTVNGVSGTGTVRLDLNGNGTGIVDGTGNPIAGGYASGDVYTIDQTGPTVSIARSTPSASTTNASSVTFRAVFTESVNAVDSSDFSLATTGTATGSIASVSASSGLIFTITVNSISGTGDLQLNLMSSGTGITDSAGNPVASGFSGQAYTIDQAGPSVTAISRYSPTNPSTGSSSVLFKVIFNEPVMNADALDFTLVKTGLVGGAIGTFSAGAQAGEYLVQVAGITGEGTLRLDLNSSGTGITDSLGNAITGGFSSGETYAIDRMAPAVSSITHLSPNQSVTGATSVTYRVTFTEPVANVDALDFTLVRTGTATGTLVSFPYKFSSTFDVTVSGISGNGTLRLDLKSSATGIMDNVGNPVSGGFTTGEGYTIDTVAPIASAIDRLSPAGQITNTSTVQFRVTFSETVSGIDTGDFALILPTGLSASIASVSASSGSVIDVTVSGITGTGELRLDLNNSGTGITDTAANILSGGFTSGQSYQIDQTAPVASVSAEQTVGGDDLVSAAEKSAGFNVVARSSKAGGTLYLVPTATALTAGATANAAIASAAVTQANTDTTLAVSAGNISVTHGTRYEIRVVDAVGNFAATAVFAFSADLSAPGIASLVPADNAGNVAPETSLQITFTEAVARGAGSIHIVRDSDSAVVATIAADSSEVSITGSQVAIQPAAPLALGMTCHVEIDAGALTDLAGNPFAGLSGASDWNFTVVEPDIAVLGNATPIQTGDTTPAAADGSDFGDAELTSGSTERTFTIGNLGATSLTLGGPAPYVRLSGHTADFTVTASPDALIASGQSSTFKITFNPTARGLRSATVRIASDDPDESPYTFTIQGTCYEDLYLSAYLESPLSTAGEASTVRFQVANSAGDVDATFDGTKPVIITVIQAAPDGSFGRFAGQAIAAGTAAGSISFADGVATAPLILNAAGPQLISFTIVADHIAPASPFLNMVDPAPVAALALDQDIAAPLANGLPFASQPSVKLLDRFGNLCLDDSRTVVTAEILSGDRWTLQGTRSVQATNGYAEFTDLAADNAALVPDAAIYFHAAPNYAVTTANSTAMALPAPTLAHHATVSYGQLSPQDTGLAGQTDFRITDNRGTQDALFTGTQLVSVSGYAAAPDGTFGSLNGVVLEADGSTEVPVTFTQGFARVPLVLNKAGTQTLAFSIAGVLNPVTNTITVTKVPSVAARLDVITDIAAPAAQNGRFMQQPVIRILDAFGNLRTADSTTEVTVVRGQEPPYTWNVTGTVTMRAVNGIVTFTDLGVTNDYQTPDVRITYNSTTTPQMTSAAVTLTGPLAAQRADAAASQTEPTVGMAARITLRVLKSDGLVDYQVNGAVSVTISGYRSAPNGQAAYFNSQPLSGDATPVSLQFRNGVAMADLCLYNSSSQTIGFLVSGIAAAEPVAIVMRPVPATAATLEWVSELAAPLTANSPFARQPVLRLADRFGNTCSNDSTSQASASVGDFATDWNLTGTVAVQADKGIFTFTDLGASSDFAVNGARVRLTDSRLGQVIHSAAVALPGLPRPESLTFAIGDPAPRAGSFTNISLTARNASGGAEVSYTGERLVALTGYEAAPDGSIGSVYYLNNLDSLELADLSSTGTTLLLVKFTAGETLLHLNLHRAGSASIRLSLADAVAPNAAPAAVSPVPDVAATLALTADAAAPAANGGRFASQPVLSLSDRFGNLCTNDSTTTVTAARADNGSWTLTGTLTATADNGRVTFNDLGAENRFQVTDARIAFSASLQLIAPKLLRRAPTQPTTVMSGLMTLPGPLPAHALAAAAGRLNPLAGTAATIALTVRDSAGATDETFTGTHRITISGYETAAEATGDNFPLGTLADIALEADGTTVIDLDFAAGETTTALILTSPSRQAIHFSVDGVANPAEPLVFTPVEVTVTPDDPETGVSGSGLDASLSLPELSEPDTTDVRIELSVTDVTPAGFGTGTPNFLLTASAVLDAQGAEILKAFDISILKTVTSGEGITATTVPNSDIIWPITIRLPLPPEYANRKDLQVVYIDDAGKLTRLATTLVNADGKVYLEFTTTHFSVYAITAAQLSRLPVTGERSSPWPALLLLLAAALVATARPGSSLAPWRAGKRPENT